MMVVETSIIGDDFGHFECEPFDVDRKCPYVYLEVEGYENPILVKVLKFRRKRRNEKLPAARFFRKSSPKEVERIMLNMVKGVIWENGLNAKIREGFFDSENGVLKIRYVSDKPFDLKAILPFLVKRLHVRVEFEFVDTAKYSSEVGWLDRCGLEICCKVFLKNIPRVSQDMARRQYLFAAPDKLTGACGRFLCCLTYELPFYDEMSSKVPSLNSTVNTDKGEGKVVEINLVAGYYILRFPDGTKEKVKIE